MYVHTERLPGGVLHFTDKPWETTPGRISTLQYLCTLPCTDTCCMEGYVTCISCTVCMHITYVLCLCTLIDG